MGFAIPVNTIARVVPQLIQNGRVQRPDAGIVKVHADRSRAVDRHDGARRPGAARRPARPADRRREQRQGPFVTDIGPSIWAAADLIVAVDGQPIKTADDFLNAVEAKQPGDQVVVTVIRGGQQYDVPLTLGGGG